MTTELRTNTFTSSEPFAHCILSLCVACTHPLQIHRVIPLTQIIDFAFLKICYVGAWKCQGRCPGCEIYWEFIDQRKLLSNEGEGGKGPRAAGSSEFSHCFLFHPGARTYIWQICIHVYLHRSNQASSC